MSEVQDKVVEIVCNQLEISKEDVTPDSSLVEDLGADSLDTVELVMAFEEEFGLEIPDDEAENCLLYTSPSPRDKRQSRMPSSA